MTRGEATFLLTHLQAFNQLMQKVWSFEKVLNVFEKKGGFAGFVFLKRSCCVWILQLLGSRGK